MEQEQINSFKKKNNIKNIVIIVLAFLLLCFASSPSNTNQDKINELEKQIEDKQNTISTIQSEKNSLQKENSKLEEEINDLKAQLETQNVPTNEDENLESQTTSSSLPKDNTTTSQSSPNVSSSSSNTSTSEQDNQEEMVWVGDTGTKYHHKNCRTLKGNGHQITLKQALAEGREPCKVCY